MKMFKVTCKYEGRLITELLVFSPGLDAGQERVKRYLQENHPTYCVPGTTIQFDEIEPSKILKTTDKKPKKAKKRG